VFPFISAIRAAASRLPSLGAFVCRNAFSEREPNVLRRVITRYVSRHPRASDTLAGIAEWWLPKGTKATPRELDSALDELVADGILQCTTLPGGTKLYSARRNKR
jgi:hypothetical protein